MEQSIATTQIFNADCLEKMKDLDDKSVDLIFCDLPYNQTSCAWDKAVLDLEQFWIQVMRIKKLNTPIFFTTTTKFGVSLIQSAPKKCFFRYDLVWVKSAPAGFLSAKKMPMRKHEMIYVFYEKLPFYDLSSHKHKFIKEMNNRKGKVYNSQDTESKDYKNKSVVGKYDPPLPVSVVKQLEEGQTLGDKGNECYGKFSYYNNGVKGYDPPLPVSVVKELMDKSMYGELPKTDSYAESIGINKADKHKVHYEPPLPTTMLEIKSTRGKHSTEKPVALMEWVLKYYSKENDIILDPTMGSGSTGVACKNMNRNFIGIEMDEEIFKVAQERLK